MDEKQETKTALQPEISKGDYVKPWQFKPGQSGNPSGKPKGTVSLKTWAQKYIQELTDDEKLEFIGGLDKIDIWKMSEGNPNNALDLKANITMSDVIKRRTESNRRLRPVVGQVISDVGTLPDTQQEQTVSSVYSEQSPSSLPSTQMVEKYNPEESAAGVYNGGSY